MSIEIFSIFLEQLRRDYLRRNEVQLKQILLQL